MSILTKAASSYTDVVGTWSSQTNAYSTTSDDQYASITLNTRNGTAEIRYGFPSFTTGDIPDGSTINSVKVSAEVGLNQSISSTIDITIENPSGTDVGTAGSTSSTSDVLIESSASTIPTLQNLRDQTVFAHFLYDRANSNTSETARIDYVSITVDYTPSATNTFAQAQAHIITITSVSAQATARIYDPDAYTYVYDTFTRTTSAGSLGTSDNAGDWQLWSNPLDISVDGSKIVKVGATDNTVRACLQYLVLPEFWMTRFKFTASAIGALETSIHVRDGSDASHTNHVKGAGIGFVVKNNGELWLYAWSSGSGSGVLLSGTFGAGETWNFRGFTKHVDTDTSTTVYGRAWKEGSPEPTTWDTFTQSVPPDIHGNTSVYFRADTGADINVDNLEIGQAYFEQVGQAQALILGVPRQHAQAEAEIISSVTEIKAHAQSEASIKEFDIEGFAQAQTQIKTTYRAFAQASVWIKQTYPFGGSTVVAQESYAGTGNIAGSSLDIGGTWNVLTLAGTGGGYTFIYVGDGTGRHGVQTPSGSRLLSAEASGVSFSDGDVYLTSDKDSYDEDDGAMNYAPVHSGILLRKGSGDYAYRVTVSGSNVILYRITAGVVSTVASVAYTSYTASYDARYRVNISGYSPTTFKIRAWTLDQSEPNTWDIETTDNTVDNQIQSGGVGTATYSSRSSVSSTAAIFDDFLATTGSVVGPTFAQAQATIKATMSRYSQAQAAIKTTNHIWAQAQAYILGINNAFAQAEAQITAALSTRNNWAQVNTLIGVTTDLYTAVDEAILDNTDYILGPSTQPIVEIKLDDLGTPMWKKDHILYVTLFRPSGFSSLSTYLFQGTTQIAAWSITGSNFWQTKFVVLTQSQIDSITDYSDLRVRLDPDPASPYYVSQIYLQRPPAGVLAYRGYAQALATIAAITTQWAQAESQIKQTYNNFAQSNAYIKVTDIEQVAQAGAWIEQTYAQYAQAQSQVKQTYHVFAQAQAKISTTRVYAQAQTWIEQTYNNWAQANAYIKTTEVEGFAQAQAQIKQAYNVWAQSNAWIEVTANRWSQANAQIKQTYQVWAQAGAKVATTRVHAQGAAWIEQTYNVWSQANAYIKSTEIEGFAQAQATIKTTYRVWSQAQAQIKTTYNSFAQANAWIKLTDNESVAQAAASIKQAYSVFAQATTWIEQTYNAWAQAQASIKTTYSVFAQAEAQVIISLVTRYVHAQAEASIKTTYHAYAQSTTLIRGMYLQYAQAMAQIKQTYNQPAQAQSDIKQTYNGFAQAAAWIEVTTNQSAQASVWIKATSNGYAQSQADIKQTYRGFAQAQTKIATTRVHAQAQTNIKATYSVFAQAQAKIATTRVHAQAQTWIENTYRGYAQAASWIKTTYNGYAQAQAQVKQTYSNWAQAQAKIATTRVHAQAQSTVKATTSAFAQTNAYIAGQVSWSAQAQANIAATSAQFAQAEAWIETTTNQSGQSSAWIEQTTFSYAQAQANIEATYSVFAQASAWIENTYRGFAQAQTYILLSGLNGYGQAQALILQTYRGFAQANAYVIVRDIEAYAQAAATIEATYNVWAQSQAYIKVTDNEAQAQAQALIKQTYNVFAQSETYIKTTDVEAYAQAGATIKTTYTAHAQAEAYISTTNIVSAQAQAQIYTPQHVHPVADISNDGWRGVVI